MESGREKLIINVQLNKSNISQNNDWYVRWFHAFFAFEIYARFAIEMNETPKLTETIAMAKLYYNIYIYMLLYKYLQV